MAENLQDESKVARIRVEPFGPVPRPDEQGKREVKALLRHRNANDNDNIPNLTHVSNHLAAQAALELIRICEANQKRDERISSPADALADLAAKKKT